MPMREDGKGVQYDEIDYLKTYHGMEGLMGTGLFPSRKEWHICALLSFSANQ